MILTLSGADVRAINALVLIPKHRGRNRFFSGIFPLKMKFNHSVLGSDGGRLWRLLCSLVHPKTQHKASLVLLCITPVMADRIFSLRAVFMLMSVTNGQDFFPSVTCTEGESETAHSERLFMIYWFYKRMSWWIFTIIGWLFSHIAATQLCSNSL